MTEIVRTWIALIVLSVLTTGIALSAFDPILKGVVILIIAGAKTQLILLWYLELAHVSGWRQGVILCLWLYCAVLLGLYIVAEL